MRILRVVAILGVGVFASAGWLSNASAGGPAIQDNRISAHSKGPYLGVKVFTETGAGQTVRKDAPPGKTLKFFTAVRNLGGSSAIHIEGSGDSACFRVQY